MGNCKTFPQSTLPKKTDAENPPINNDIISTIFAIVLKKKSRVLGLAFQHDDSAIKHTQ